MYPTFLPKSLRMEWTHFQIFLHLTTKELPCMFMQKNMFDCLLAQGNSKLLHKQQLATKLPVFTPLRMATHHHGGASTVELAMCVYTKPTCHNLHSSYRRQLNWKSRKWNETEAGNRNWKWSWKRKWKQKCTNQWCSVSFMDSWVVCLNSTYQWL